MALGDYLTGTNIGLTAAIILAIWAAWILFRKPSGRLGEEKLEEKETDQLKKEELVVEATQKDEKKQCSILERTFYDLLTVADTIDNQIRLKTKNSADMIFMLLRRFREEAMSVEVALDNFRMFHESINEFLTYLPKGNKEIARLVVIITDHQNKYYKDLITELNMDRLKQAQLKKLWIQALNEIRGKGVIKAA